MSDMPGGIARLPLDRHHRPVPWFTAWFDGVPDFRVIGRGKIRQAIAYKLCWTCGLPFLRQENRVFVVGPMCGVNRISSEPPSHLDCARYAAVHCPFLSRPEMRRRERGTEGLAETAGVALLRNPGVTLLWPVRYNDWHHFQSPERDGAHAGTLFSFGPARGAEWYCQGRAATRAEVEESVASGLPALEEAATRQPGASEELAAQVVALEEVLPV